jgi:hypothetical protein
LKTWKILGQLRCFPHRTSPIMQAILLLQLIERAATQDEKRSIMM